MRKFPLLLLLLAACEGEAPQNAAEMANEAENTAAVEAPTEANGAAAAPRPTLLEVGPLRIPYDAALLTPVETRIALPPDWKLSVQGTKLIGQDRAALLGKAECLYGQSGEASLCNAEQEAGLAFAALGTGFAEASARIPASERQTISLAGAEGVSWLIGAEGEGAEYILLPAGTGDEAGTVLIVRQFRTSGNPNEEALGTVLGDLMLKRPE